ncbi:hypothetical protein GCM10007922_10490 [Shewanella decolorationis]|nr:hypothetical protein GCM10007922_10490 [Shewanella decolorationis]
MLAKVVVNKKSSKASCANRFCSKWYKFRKTSNCGGIAINVNQSIEAKSDIAEGGACLNVCGKT